MLKIQPPNYKFCPFCGKELRTKLEENKKRKFCPFCKWTYYPHVGTAVAAVIIKDNKVLMVKRKREPFRGTWMFPAGFVDYGEHPEDALVREVKEETGLKTKEAELLKIIQIEDDPRSLGHFCFFYKVIAEGEGLTTNKEENEGIDWFDLDKPPKIGWKSHKEIWSLFGRHYTLKIGK